MKHTYYPKGTCSTQFDFEVENGIIKSFNIKGGCPGNTKGICNLINGMNVEEVISKLKDVPCFNKMTGQPRISSCPNEIAKALIDCK